MVTWVTSLEQLGKEPPHFKSLNVPEKGKVSALPSAGRLGEIYIYTPSVELTFSPTFTRHSSLNFTLIWISYLTPRSIAVRLESDVLPMPSN